MNVFMLSKLIEVLESLKQGPSRSPPRVRQTDTRDDETDASKECRKVLSEKTFKIERVYGASELATFFVTSPSDAASNPNQFLPGWPRKCFTLLCMGIMKCCGIFKGLGTLPEITVSALGHPGEARLISTGFR